MITFNISYFLIISSISSYFIGFLYGENSAGAGTFTGDFVFLWRNLQTFVNNDLNGDGILELLIAHGESAAEPLSLFSANVKDDFQYLRIEPRNSYGAPARGATVTLKTNFRTHAKTIDAGSGYLCQMEPVAHFGIRKNEEIEYIQINWTDGQQSKYKIEKLNLSLIHI